MKVLKAMTQYVKNTKKFQPRAAIMEETGAAEEAGEIVEAGLEEEARVKEEAGVAEEARLAEEAGETVIGDRDEV